MDFEVIIKLLQANNISQVLLSEVLKSLLDHTNKANLAFNLDLFYNPSKYRNV